LDTHDAAGRSDPPKPGHGWVEWDSTVMVVHFPLDQPVTLTVDLLLRARLVAW